ncbi:CysB family HTH-type transcriptional regulator [Caballeronia sp. dw_19]|uniref:CysB family HTH-type transcriptional regulator n=1 Tax=Caballeronia sp. dw_19 TaxID=2719791 RepID=UPI001BD4BCB9|nr:CysB family HTH-type transcriptional regulator [Caballeronia sp. dw_19]
MNLLQLRFTREIVRQNFNMTAAAQALSTSQPAVSRAVIELEEELGVQIFIRHGKRVQSLSAPGRLIVTSIEQALQSIESLARVAEEFSAQNEGHLAIAATHTQARYLLPPVVALFRHQFPKVHLSILQGTPTQVAQLVLDGKADIGIATEALTLYNDLISVPCAEWHHIAIIPDGHPLLAQKRLSLNTLARYPLMTYESSFSGRTKIDEAFAAQHLHPDIVLEAIDADVIKTYVSLGLGVGLISSLAFDADRDKGLNAISVRHLFGQLTARLAYRKGRYLRSYVHEFARQLSPTIDAELADMLKHE